jgi:hypothetical protein
VWTQNNGYFHPAVWTQSNGYFHPKVSAQTKCINF